MWRWKIIIEAWPHSSGKGQEADQAAAGEREQYFYCSAEDIQDAMRFADCFAEGMKSNPAVWVAKITGINRYRDNS